MVENGKFVGTDIEVARTPIGAFDIQPRGTDVTLPGTHADFAFSDSQTNVVAIPGGGFVRVSMRDMNSDGNMDVISEKYSPLSGAWEAPEIVAEGNNTVSYHSPAAAFTTTISPTIVITYDARGNTTSTLEAKEKVGDGAWTAITAPAATVSGDMTGLDMVYNPVDNAFYIVFASTGSGGLVFDRLDAATDTFTGWEEAGPRQILPLAGTHRDPNLTVDGDGNLHVISEGNPTGPSVLLYTGFNIVTNQFEDKPGSGSGAYGVFPASPASNPDIAVDPLTEEVTVVYQRFSIMSGSKIEAKRYNGTIWTQLDGLSSAAVTTGTNNHESATITYSGDGTAKVGYTTQYTAGVPAACASSVKKTHLKATEHLSGASSWQRLGGGGGGGLVIEENLCDVTSYTMDNTEDAGTTQGVLWVMDESGNTDIMGARETLLPGGEAEQRVLEVVSRDIEFPACGGAQGHCGPVSVSVDNLLTQGNSDNVQVSVSFNNPWDWVTMDVGGAPLVIDQDQDFAPEWRFKVSSYDDPSRVLDAIEITMETETPPIAFPGCSGPFAANTSYVLTSDVDCSSTGMTIAADGVRILGAQEWDPTATRPKITLASGDEINLTGNLIELAKVELDAPAGGAFIRSTRVILVRDISSIGVAYDFEVPPSVGTDPTTTLTGSSIEDGLVVLGASDRIGLWGNEFKTGSGISLLAGATNPIYCEEGSDNISGAGNYFDPSIPPASAPVGICNDYDSNGVPDGQQAGDVGTDHGFSDFWVQQGDKIISPNSYALNELIGIGYDASTGEIGTMERNCEKYRMFTEVANATLPCSTDKIAISLDNTHLAGSLVDTQIETAAGPTDLRGAAAFMREFYVAGDTVLNMATAASAEGMTMFVKNEWKPSLFNNTGGNFPGTAERDQALDILKSTKLELELPAGVTYECRQRTAPGVYSDVAVTAVPTANCEILKITESNGNGWDLDFGALAGVNKLTDLNGAPLEDLVTGVSSLSADSFANPLPGDTHHNEDGAVMALHDDPTYNRADIKSHLDYADSGMTRTLRPTVDVSGSTLTIQLTDTGDFFGPFGGQAHDGSFFAQGVVISAKSKLKSGDEQTLTLENKKIWSDSPLTSNPQGNTEGNQNQTEGRLYNIRNNEFSLVSTAVDSKVRKLVRSAGMEPEQKMVASAPYQPCGVALVGIGGDISGNKIAPAGDTTLLTPVFGDANTAVGGDDNAFLLDGVCGIAVGSANNTGGTNFWNIANNTGTGLGAGVGVAGVQAKVAGNDMTLDTDSAAIEAIADANAAELYSDLVLLDSPEADGRLPSKRVDSNLANFSDKTPTGYGYSCGREKVTRNGDYDTLAYLDAEKSIYGDDFDTATENLAFDSCEPAVFEDNISRQSGGLGFGVASTASNGTGSHDQKVCTAGLAAGIIAPLDPDCGVFENYNVIVRDNQVLPLSPPAASSDEPTGSFEPLHLEASPVPRQASGADVCMSFGKSQSREAMHGSNFSPTPTVAVANVPRGEGNISVDYIPDDTSFAILRNTCGPELGTEPGGGIGVGGSGTAYLRGNVIRRSEFMGIHTACSGYGKQIRTAADSGGLLTEGEHNSCVVAMVDNTIQEPGTQLGSIAEGTLFNSKVGAQDGIERDFFRGDISVSVDTGAPISQDQAIVIADTKGSADTIWLEFADANIADDPAQTSQWIQDELDLQLVGNVVEGTTTPMTVEIGSVSDSAVHDAVVSEVLPQILPGTITVNCAQKGGGASGACLAGTSASLYVRDECSETNPALIDQNCKALITEDLVDNGSGLAVADLAAPFGEHMFILAKREVLGSTFYSTHPGRTLNAGNPTHTVTLIMNEKTGFNNQQVPGSLLNVYTPYDVIWMDEVQAVYPIVYLTDNSAWTVEACADVPEGYQVDGATCQSTAVSNELIEQNFTVLEVGSVPGPTALSFTMTTPEGEEKTLEAEVGVRLTPELAEIKGVSVNANGHLAGQGSNLAQAEEPTEEPAATPTEVSEPSTTTTPTEVTPPAVETVEPTTAEAADTGVSRNTTVIIIAIVVVVLLIIIGVALYMGGRKGKGKGPSA